MLGSVALGDVLADAAYDSNILHEALAARDARANVKPKDRSKMLLTRGNVLIDWQRELEDRAPGRIGARPQSSAV